MKKLFKNLSAVIIMLGILVGCSSNPNVGVTVKRTWEYPENCSIHGKIIYDRYRDYEVSSDEHRYCHKEPVIIERVVDRTDRDVNVIKVVVTRPIVHVVNTPTHNHGTKIVVIREDRRNHDERRNDHRNVQVINNHENKTVVVHEDYTDRKEHDDNRDGNKHNNKHSDSHKRR